MATSREKLMEILKDKFPKMWMKLGEEFGSGLGDYSNTIWTGENSFDNDGYTLFDYYSEDFKETMYVMGVRKSLFDLLDENGWYCEWYDAGTILIYES